jgi:GDPmannose 4,6-dehydratase
VESLLGDATKARDRLGWQPRISAREMCTEMMAHDLAAAQRLALLKAHGHDVALPGEGR